MSNGELFFVMLFLCLATVIIGVRLVAKIRVAADTVKKIKFMWLIHIFVCSFLFVPFVAWPIMANPVISAIPAGVELAFSVCIFLHSDVQNRSYVIAFFVSSIVMWICYGYYEYNMQIWARTVTGPIRIDLEVLLPLLYYSMVLLLRLAHRKGCIPGKIA